MKRYLIATLVFGSLMACSDSKVSKTNSNNGPTLLTIAGDEVTVKEFKYVYGKNNTNSKNAYEEKSLKDYIDLYVNFRLKVKEAEELGYAETKDFKQEFNQYRGQLAAPYLTEKDVSERLLKEAYDRKKQEVNASHILIKFPQAPSPKDTLNAYSQIVDIKNKLKNGADFDELASKLSQDPSAKKNKGNLGYFSSMQMVYPFENAAYNTEIGKLSKVLRTRFGYHILKVNDKRVARGEIKISHIMIRAVE